MMGYTPPEHGLKFATGGNVGREPCPLCNGLGGWDRHGKPIASSGEIPERTTCQGCDGCGEFVSWLRDAMGFAP